MIFKKQGKVYVEYSFCFKTSYYITFIIYFIIQLAAGKVGFHFVKSNIYLLGNDSNNDIENKSAKALLHSSGVYDTSGNNKSKYTSAIIVRITSF